MAAAIELRTDFTGDALRKLAKASADANQACRLLALAAIYDGASRGQAAKIGGVTLQIVRDWVLRFNAEGPTGLVDRKAPGKPAILNDAQRLALAKAVDDGPKPYLHGVVRWRLIDLVQWLYEAFGVSVSEDTVSRELKAMGFRKLSARPRHHAQDGRVIDAFKKTSPPSWRRYGAASRQEPRSRSGSRTKLALARRTS